MRPGDTITPTIYRQTAAGVGTTGKALGNFIFQAIANGTPVSVSPGIVEGTPIGSPPNQRTPYALTLTLPNYKQYFSLSVLPDTPTDVIIDGEFNFQVTANDVDSLAATLLLNQGTPAVNSATPSTLGDVVDGDTFSSTISNPTHLVVPSAKLAPFGQSTLTGLTAEAAVSNVPGVGGTSYPITVTVVDAVNLLFDLSWPGGGSQPFPLLPAGQSTPVTWYIDVQFIKSGTPNIIVTTNRYTFFQQPQYDPRTS